MGTYAIWVCEQHPYFCWPHNDCAGPGMLLLDYVSSMRYTVRLLRECLTAAREIVIDSDPELVEAIEQALSTSDWAQGGEDVGGDGECR